MGIRKYYFLILLLVPILFSISINDAHAQYLGNVAESIIIMTQNGSPYLGDPNAPITLVEFGDYQDFFSNRFFHDTEPSLVENYIETSKVKMIFKDFTIIGPDSTTAAHAAHCADDQDLFWEYHDTLYNNWNGENNGWASSENLLRMAQDVGLNIDEYTDCMTNEIHAQIISASYDDAQTLGLTGTPGFFVIGSNQYTKISGAQPYSVFENVINELLEELEPEPTPEPGAEPSIEIGQPYQDEFGRWNLDVSGTGFYHNLDIYVTLENRLTDNVRVNGFQASDKTDLNGNFAATLISDGKLAESGTYSVEVFDVIRHTFLDIVLQLGNYPVDLITLEITPQDIPFAQPTIVDVMGFVNLPDGINESFLSDSIEIQIGKQGERYTEWGIGTSLMPGTNMFHTAQVITLQTTGELNVYVLHNGAFRTFTINVIPPPESEVLTISSVVIEQFESHEGLRITGTGAEGSRVIIDIFDPEGEKIVTLDTPITGGGDFTTLWFIPKEILTGTYTIKASDNFDSVETTFFIEGISPPEPEPEPTPDEIDVDVRTSKSEYVEGDLIIILGEVSFVLENVPMSVVILGPNGNTIFVDQAQVSDSGSFTSTTDSTGAGFKNEGTYLVQVHYADFTAETSFEFKKESIPEPEPEISGFELVIELPQSAGEEFSLYADRNEANNLQRLQSFVLNSNEPIKTLETIIIELREGTNTASENLDTVPRWTPEGIETLEYGIFWTELRANNDIRRIASQVIQMVEEGMSLETAFDQFDYIIHQIETEPTGEIIFKNPRIIDAFGNPIDDIELGDHIQFSAIIDNQQSRDLDFAFAIIVKTEQGFVENEGWITGILNNGESLEPAISWVPESAGDFTVSLQLWNDPDERDF